MAEYATDEEQVEAIKKWWSENGNFLIGGIVLGLALLFGWNYWKDYRITQGREASAVYSQLLAGNDAKAQLGTLKNDYGDTPYAALGALQAAKSAVEDGDLGEAATILRSVVTDGGDLNVSDVARLRLARVLLADGKADEALKEAETVTAAAYISLREEVRGDALVTLGRTGEAIDAYDKALLSAGSRVEFLQLKRDNLGQRKMEAS